MLLLLQPRKLQSDRDDVRLLHRPQILPLQHVWNDPETLRRTFLRHWRRPRAAEVTGATKEEDGLHCQLPPPLFFYDTQENKNSEIMITGATLFLYKWTRREPNVSHLLLPFPVLAWECAGSASMLHSSLLQKEDGDLDTAARCPPCCPDNTTGVVPHLTNHTPCLPLCLWDTGEMLDPRRRNATVMTSSIPSQRSQTNAGEMIITPSLFVFFFPSFKLCISTVMKPHSGVVVSLPVCLDSPEEVTRWIEHD